MKKFILITVFITIIFLLTYNFYQQKNISSTKPTVTPTLKVQCNFEKSSIYYSYHNIKDFESEIKNLDDKRATASSLLVNLKNNQPPKYAPMSLEEFAKLVITKTPSVNEEKYNEVVRKNYQDFILKVEEGWKADVVNFNKTNKQKIEKVELLINALNNTKKIYIPALEDIKNCKVVNIAEFQSKINQIMILLKQQNEQITL